MGNHRENSVDEENIVEPLEDVYIVIKSTSDLHTVNVLVEGNVVEPLKNIAIDVYVVIKSTLDLNSVSTKSDQNQELILDSGCTFRMTSRKLWLENYKNTNRYEVMMGNNAVCRVVGIGSVTLKFENGSRNS